MEELETDEVEAGLGFDYPALVERLLGTQYREVDPGESRVESRAPDHVGDLCRTAVLELWQPVLDTGDSRNPFHSKGGEVSGLDSDQRFTGGDPLGTGLLADRSLGCQHPVKDDPADERHQDAGGNTLGPEGNGTRVRSREQDLVGPGQLDGDLGARVT